MSVGCVVCLCGRVCVWAGGVWGALARVCVRAKPDHHSGLLGRKTKYLPNAVYVSTGRREER